MIYCYETTGGAIVERVYPAGKAPRHVRVGKQMAKRSFRAEHASVPATAGWPMACVGSGVNPDQAGELRAHFEKVGVPTDVTSQGDPVYRDAKHRKKALKCRGMFDKASYL